MKPIILLPENFYLQQGDLIAAFTKIWQAIRELKKAQKLGAPTLELQKKLCYLTLELTRVRLSVIENIYGKDNPDVVVIRRTYEAGVSSYNVGDYENAASQFKWCQQKIGELDNQPPVIQIISPQPNKYFNVKTPPKIYAVYTDILTAIRRESVQIWIDGITYTNLATISAADLRLIPPPLAEGQHTVTISVSDVAVPPNISVSSVVFFIDTTPPTGSVSINAGAPATSDTTVSLTLFAQDPESGVSEMRGESSGDTILNYLTG